MKSEIKPKEEIADSKLQEYLDELLKSSYKGQGKLKDIQEADSVVSKRIEQQTDISPNIRPMEYVYCRNWGKIRENHDIPYDLKECNPNYQFGKEWKINCQRCVPTYEMRRRGYDVTANPKPREVDPSDLCYRPFDVWSKPDVIQCRGNGKKDIEGKMMEWGDGARAQVVVSWKNTKSGHTFIAEQKDGKTVFLDPQTGEKNVERYFRIVKQDSVKFCRIDNQDVTSKVLDCSRRV